MDWCRARLYAFVHEHEIVGCGQHVPFGHELEIHQIQLVVLSEHLCVSLLQLIVQIGRENILLYQVLSLLRVCTQIFLLLVCLLSTRAYEIFPKLTLVIELLLLS